MGVPMTLENGVCVVKLGGINKKQKALESNEIFIGFWETTARNLLGEVLR
jgi:hypothetical protein